MNGVFPRVFERRKQHARMLYRRRKQKERSTWERPEPQTRMLDLTRNSIVWQKQPTLFEFYKDIGYADAQGKFYHDLPGHGNSYDDCQKTIFKGCDHVEAHPEKKTFVRLARRSCNRKTCPKCYEGWSSHEAERITIRTSSYLSGPDTIRKTIDDVVHEFQADPPAVLHGAIVAAMEEIMGSSNRPVIHLMLSPPQDLYDGKSIDGFRNLRKTAMDLAKISGFRGGCMFFHPYRLKCPSCGLAYPDYHKICSCGSNEAPQWFWSPHFHCLGFGWIEDTKELYGLRGWVIKNLKARESVFWTAQYLLSHAGISPRIHTTTWFGELGYHSLMMKDTPRMMVVQEICPYCRRVLRPLLWIGGEDRGPPEFNVKLAKVDPHLNEFLAASGEWRCH